MPTLFSQLQIGKDSDPEPPNRTTTSGASRNGRSKRTTTSVASRNGSSGNKMDRNVSRTSQVREEVQREFLRTTAKGTQDEVYTNPETLPSIEMAYNTFQRAYPKFSETWAVDDLRDREFFHLEESQHVCMDYCGFGLFSYYQQIINKASSSFGLAYISANLHTHALYGAADVGTVEFYIRERVMNYLNINDTDYSMVFTASRGSAFKLLAESYPFRLNQKLLTVYDFQSEAVNWMADCAKQKGAKIMSACFKWPSLRIGTTHLKKLLQGKKKKSESAKGLFVFPVQSRMTGAKYSYQWMSEAQQNKWHVLLDASSLGPKDMDSLGLSLFRPDFIVSSFYKVFGTDPTGFGCLFIKNTAIHSLQSSSRARAVGMVRIVSLSNFTSDGPEVQESEDDGEVQLHKRSWGLEQHDEDSLSSFSGPYFAAVEPEVKIKHTVKESNHRAWKSWKRSGKMALHNRERSVRSAGSDALMDTVGEIGGGGASKVELVAQPTKSRHYSGMRVTEIEEEQPNRGSGTWHDRERNRRLSERTESEIEELDNDQVSEVGNGHWPSDSQWRSHGRVTGIQREYKPIEFQSLSGKGISPILEADAEDQEVEEGWESERCSKSSDTANGSEGAHVVLSEGRFDGGANEIDEDTVDLERNSVNKLTQFDAEAVEDAGRMKRDAIAVEELRHGSSSALRETGSEEIPESNLASRRRQHAVNKGCEVEDVEESSDSLVSGELRNDVLKSNVLSRTLLKPRSQSSVKARLHPFETRAGFKRHTGKQLGNFQEIGVQGLVQKYESENSFHKQFEGTVDAKFDLSPDDQTAPVRIAYLLPGDSPRGPGASREVLMSPTRTQDVAEVVAEDNSSRYENAGQFEAATNNPSAVTKPIGTVEVVRGRVLKDGPGHGIFETESPAAGGNLKENVYIKASATDGDCNIEEDPSFMEKKPGAISESATMDPLREVSSVDGCERSVDLNIEHRPTQETAVHSLQHLSSFSGHVRTPYESGEESFTTILPRKTAKNRSKRLSEAVIETRASGSQEQSDKETSSARESEQREHVPTKDDSPSPEKRFRIEHVGEEERSPSMKLDNRIPSITTTVYKAAAPNRPGKEGSGTDDVSFDIANFHDTKDQGLENGRYDLRSNRTLSRNVDFEDEMYPGRPYASEVFESGRLSTTLAEEIASLDLQDSDEESFQSQCYSGSLHGSRYLEDVLEPASYEEGEDGDTEDDYEDIQEPELQENGEPIISCKGLDFADSLGLTKLNYRLRYLINWLVNALLKLRHPGPNQGIPLVRIYGPKVQYDRGAAVSFNIFDWKGLLIQPGLVQRLADRCNISLGVGRLCNIVDPEMSPDFMAEKERLLGVHETDRGGIENSPHAGKLDIGKSGGAGDPLTIPVVTAAMGFVTSFQDVYTLWSFLAKFLDADYVSKEVWRYHSLNQQIMVM